MDNSRRVLVGILEIRPVPNPGRVKKHQVGLITRFQETSLPQAETGSGEASHFIHGRGQREDSLLASVLAQHPDEGPVGTGVSGGRGVFIGIHSLAVRPHGYLLAGHDGFYILFG